MQNDAKSLSHSRNIRKAICEWYSTPRLRDPMQLLHASIVLTDPLSHIHETLRPVAYDQPIGDGQRLTSPREPNRLNTNTRIMPSSLFIKGKPAVKPCTVLTCHLQTKFSLDLVCPSLHTRIFLLSTITLNDVTPNPHFLLWGMACSHETREGKASACLARLASF